MRVTFVTPSLGPGGAERALVSISEGLQLRGYRITVLTLHNTETDFFRLPDGVCRTALDIAGYSPTVAHGLWNNLRRLRTLRGAIEATRPDVVVSHLNRTNVLTALSLSGTACPVIAVEHSEPTMNHMGKSWEALRRLTYPRLAKVVTVSEGIKSYFSWLPERQKSVIHNPLSVSDATEAPGDLHDGLPSGRRNIVAMGRLIYLKGFDLLLAAFHRVSAKHPDWDLLILGEGEQRAQLERQREALGLAGRVSLPGLIAEPCAVLRRSDLFVMPSRTEGFPYALLEAMACALPVISMDCPSGPREIIRHGVDGMLVPDGDVGALAAQMDELMGDGRKRCELASRAPEVRERFSSEKAVEAWEALLAEVVRGRAAS